MNKRVVAIIPARGGSKGIPRKNLLSLLGQPLLYYSVNAALKSKIIQECYVSTEDTEIAASARNCGSGVIERPNELADDFVSTFDVVKHAIEVLRFPDIIVILQPTSPLRTSNDIDKAFELFTNDVVSVIGVCEFHGYLWEEDENKTVPLFEKRIPRQKMKRLFVENGALYITRKEVFANKDSRLGMGIPSKGMVKLHIMEKKHGIEIDSKDDLIVLESLLRREYGTVDYR